MSRRAVFAARGSTENWLWHTVLSVTDRELVTALRAGDRLAAGQMYDIYGTRLYAYCHELLGDHKIAGDALRDTFIAGVNRIKELRRPDELGAWLYALARGECLRAGISEEIPSDAGDAARGDRLSRLALDCYAMLPPETRELLDLAFRHRLVDTDLSRVLGLGEQEVSDLVGAAQSDLENTLLVVLAARTGDPKCPDAAELGRRFDQVDGRGVAAWVHSAARHVERCTICTATIKARRPLRLFEELPHSFMPPGVRSRVLETLRDPAGAPFATRIAERAGRFDEDGFPAAGKPGGRTGRKWVLPTAFAAAVGAAVVVGYLVLGGQSPAATPVANPASDVSAPVSVSQNPVDLTSYSPTDSPSAPASASTSSAAAQTSAAAPTAVTTSCALKPTTTPVATTTELATTWPSPVTSLEPTPSPSPTATVTVTLSTTPEPTTTTVSTTYPSPTTYKTCSAH